jgi:hypothetical protein
MILIGIDPDLRKNGVAEYNTITKKITGTPMDFWDLIAYLQKMKLTKGQEIKVKLGAGWENPKTNWHDPAIPQNMQNATPAAKESYKNKVKNRISVGTGMNHGVGIKIMEWCQRNEVPYDLCVPKKGNAKWSIAKVTKYTGIKRANEDVRDAISFIWGF